MKVDIKELDELKEEQSVLAKGILELNERFGVLVPMFKETTDAVGKLQDDLQEMPGGYRNSQDIKHLKGRIERLESGNTTSIIGVADGLRSNMRIANDRIEKECLRISSRICGIEQQLSALESRFQAHNSSPQVSMGDIKKLEECCKNTVAAGKSLEERVNKVDKDVASLSKFIQSAEAEIVGFRANIRQVVRDILKSL